MTIIHKLFEKVRLFILQIRLTMVPTITLVVVVVVVVVGGGEVSY